MAEQEPRAILERAALEKLRRLQGNPYIPQMPTPKQLAFLMAPEREVLFGGAAGPGKSSALLMAALEYVDVAGYSALLLRRTYSDLALPGALMDRAHDWLGPTDARWNGLEKTWTFPSGATVTFGFLGTANDRFRYQGSELQMVGFDELTQFDEPEYRYLLSRLRRPQGSNLPIRMRSASNPGGRGHDWVRQRFLIEGPHAVDDFGAPAPRRFIPAKLDENPYLDRAAYEASLAQLDPVTRSQLLKGDWEARPTGGWFAADDFEVVEQAPAGLREVRYWDLAASEAKPGSDPDWTVGLKLGKGADGFFYVTDVARFREAPARTESLIKHTTQMDGREVEVSMEQEPGSGGVIAIDHYRRRVLSGFSFWPVKSTGDKQSRARPASAAAAGWLIRLVRAPWNSALLEELQVFPQEGEHDDQVDALSGAFTHLASGSGAAWITAWEELAAEENPGAAEAPAPVPQDHRPEESGRVWIPPNS
jgi:predicted phage terminase large subunit-like protein